MAEHDDRDLSMVDEQVLCRRSLARPISRLKGMVPKPEKPAMLDEMQEAIEIEASLNIKK
jgi:hypothetical protein